MIEYEAQIKCDDDMILRARKQLEYINIAWFKSEERLSVGWMTQDQVKSFLGALADMRAQGKGVFEMPGGLYERKIARTVFKIEEGTNNVQIIENYPVPMMIRTTLDQLNSFERYLEGKIGL